VHSRLREEGDVDLLEQLAEHLNQLDDVALKVIFELFVFPGELLHVWDQHFHELNELLSYIGYIALQPQDDCLNQLLVSQDGHAPDLAILLNLLDVDGS
jgi:hypothetical protein